MQLNALRQKDGEKLSAIMSTRLQAYERGRQARMRWYAAIDEMKEWSRRSGGARGPRSSRCSSPAASRRPAAAEALGLGAHRREAARAGSMPVQSSLPLSGKLDAIGKGFAAGLRRKRTRIEAALAIRALQGRVHLASVLEKVLGFVVGWAVYDVAKQAHTPDSPLDFLGFATALTLICAGYTLLFGKEFKAHDRESAERIFLANALGMVQGWSWADFTGMCLRDLLEEPHLAAYPHRRLRGDRRRHGDRHRAAHRPRAAALLEAGRRRVEARAQEDPRKRASGLVQKIKEIGPPQRSSGPPATRSSLRRRRGGGAT